MTVALASSPLVATWSESDDGGNDDDGDERARAQIGGLVAAAGGQPATSRFERIERVFCIKRDDDG